MELKLMGRLKPIASAVALAALALSVPSAMAGQTVRATFSGAALSVDGWGSTASSGFLQTDVAAGSTVVAAYLYSTDVWGSGVAGNVTLDGTFLSSSSGALLPSSNPAHTRIYDVTSIVQSRLASAGGGVVNHSISEAGNSDGEVLVVAYKNASTAGGTAIIMDGGLATGGDTTHVAFASPYKGGDTILSLASSYSYSGSGTGPNPTGQYSKVDIQTSSSPASRRLTTSAGGNDDGSFQAANGALITVGGVGDNPANPADPYFVGAGGYDDELYNLALGNGVDPSPFLKTGDTWMNIVTNNPSGDDNVFGSFITTSFAVSSVNDHPVIQNNSPVPEPETYAMLIAGLGLLGAMTRRKQKKASS